MAIFCASALGRGHVLAGRRDAVDEAGQPGLLRVDHLAGQHQELQPVQVRVGARRGPARGRGRARRRTPACRSGRSRRRSRCRRPSSARSRRRARGRGWRRSSAWRTPRRRAARRSPRSDRRAGRPAPPSSPKPAMSPPTEKQRPAPGRSSTRTASSASRPGERLAQLGPELARHRVQLLGAVQRRVSDRALGPVGQHGGRVSQISTGRLVDLLQPCGAHQQRERRLAREVRHDHLGPQPPPLGRARVAGRPSGPDAAAPAPRA